MTVVVAHRTCPRDARENSLEGIVAAARLGADAVELDARRSRAGTAVVIHDPWLGRLQHVPWPVRWASDSLLHRLGVPTLVDALDTARSVGLRVAVDAKDPGVVEAVLDSVRRTNAEQYMLFWSQHMSAAEAFARAVPGGDVGLFRDTFDEPAHLRLLTDAATIGARAVSVHQDAATPGFIAAARAHDLDVYVGYQTLGVQSERLRLSADAGLTGVVTDWPAEARTVLDHMTSP